MENKQIKYTHRFLAKIVLEAKTPIAVGSGDKNIFTDALVATDVNGLPYIPGTSMAGVIRHAIDEVHKEDKVAVGKNYSDIFFGFQGGSNEGKGSEIIFSEAKMIGADGMPIDGLQNIDWKNDFYAHYNELPIRQHAKIDHRGVTVKAGKFDEQVVFKGTRFCFEMEMVSDKTNFEKFEEVLQQIYLRTFRIGSGTRCGFGEMEVVSCVTKQLDLRNKNDLDFYLNKSSKLSFNWDGNQRENIKVDSTAWTKYELTLKPEDFFLFGSGFGDAEADMTPVKGKKVDWTSGTGVLKDNLILIPATSVKGALAHRTAFYYNKLNHYFAGDERAKVGNENVAVQQLFGYENQAEKKQVRGNVIFSDIIEKKDFNDKVLNHVSIDRFTGGAIEGALFSEKTTYGKGESFTMEILVEKNAFETEKVQESFESALTDICNGMLPLGGGVNRGNGCFSGTLKRNNEQIFPKED